MGCADVAVPDSASVQRQSDLLTVRCNSSQETWYLTCKGYRWVGTMANCSTGKPEDCRVGLSLQQWTINLLLWIAAGFSSAKICFNVFWRFRRCLADTPETWTFFWSVYRFLDSTVWVKKISPTVFWIFFPNGWEFLINFYTPIIRSFLH